MLFVPLRLLSRGPIRTTGFCIRKNTQGLSRSAYSTDTPADPDFYDIVIAGGGLVGTTCAVALGSSRYLTDKKILLLESAKSFTTLEANNERGASPKFSNRVYAISPGSRSLLEKLGIWNHVWRSQDVVSMQVWDALSDSNISFTNPGLELPVATIVESPVLSFAAEQVLQKFPNIRIEFGCGLQDSNLLGGCPTQNLSILLSSGKTIHTNLLIGADGFRSRVRQVMGSKYLHGNYNRTAIVATLQLIEKTENNTAWQRFLPTGGPIALLPLSPEFSSLVWSTTTENAKRLMEVSEVEFAEEVNSAFWKDYPQSFLVQKACEIFSSFQAKKPRTMLPPSLSAIVPNSRATFPLGFGHSSYYVNHRVALIGDAAHRIHPLGGQGLNLGIGDVGCLVKVLEAAVVAGENLGRFDRLARYETERQRHNVAIQAGVDALHRLYSFDISPVVAFRSLGLSLVNSSESVKRRLIAEAAA